MTLPKPMPGLVVRYAYLWHDEKLCGNDTGEVRPCIVIDVFPSGDRQRVLLIPITHTQPFRPIEGIEIPDAVKKHLGLDMRRQWAIRADANEFNWVGPDLSIVPGTKPRRYEYGVLPPTFFKAIRDRLLYVANGKKLKVAVRTE